jgi:putative hydrolase of the HAD superfamily
MGISVIWFDLDNTLYPESSGLLTVIDRRINEFISRNYGVPEADAPGVRKRLYVQYGATLLGLWKEYGTGYDDYVDFVYDVKPGDYITPDPAIRATLLAIPRKKVVFSNSNLKHLTRVCTFLNILDCFDNTFFLDRDLIAKPDPRAYEKARKALGCAYGDCLLIDDVDRNLAAGKNLGMRTLKVNERMEGNGYDCISNIRELKIYLDKKGQP